MPRTRTYGLDVDAIAYAARVKAGSGVAILPEPLKQLNKFIVGIKKLGLWNDMICWPMRSIHNAGRGSTLYSLGGLGIFNGTLINDTRWDYNGLLTYNGGNGSVSVIFLSLTNSNFPITYFASNIRNANDYTSGIDPLIGLGSGASSLVLSRRGPTSTGSDNYTIRSGSGLNINSGLISPFNYYTIYSRVDSNFANLSINSGAVNYSEVTTAQNIGTPSTALILSQKPSSGTGNSIQGFAMIILNRNTDNKLIHNLYRQTLGQGFKLSVV